MIKRTKLIITLITIIFIVSFTTTVYAAQINFGHYTPTTHNESSSDSTPSHPCPTSPAREYYEQYGVCPTSFESIPEGSIAGVDYEYACTYNFHVSPNTQLTIDSYDMLGNSLLQYSLSTEGHKFTAGTWIGLSNKEIKTASWSVSRNAVFKKTYNYTCQYQGASSTSKTISSRCVSSHKTETCTSYNTTTYQVPYYACSTDIVCTGYDIAISDTTANTCTCKKCTHQRIDTVCDKYRYSTSTVTTPGPTASTTETTGNSNYECPSEYVKDGATLTLTSQPSTTTYDLDTSAPEAIVRECKKMSNQMAKTTAENMVKNPTSAVKYINTNTYPNGEDSYTGTLSKLTAISDNMVYTNLVEYTGESEYVRTYTYGSGTVSLTHRYMPKYVCLNVKTGNIRYITGTSTSHCSSSEIVVPNGEITDSRGNVIDVYWRYFIPLNTMTGKDFYVRIEKDNTNNTNQLDVGECNSIIRNYPINNDYRRYIVKKNGYAFTGRYLEDKNYIDSGYACIDISDSKKLSNEDCENIMQQYGNYKQKITKKDGTTFSGNKRQDLRYIGNIYACKNSSGTELTLKQCTNEMNSHPLNNDYTYYIRRTNGDSFVGDYDIVNNPDASSSDKTDIASDNGCILSTKISFDVEQKFYRETTSEYRTLKGYGMYFRQIDINNPFPNGLTNSVYWGDIYNTRRNAVVVNNQTTTLSASYSSDNITYVAENISRSDIEEYNSDEPYTSWQGMKVEGISTFITDASFITRKHTGSYYKLGCGPSNQTWEGCNNS